jgi:hypothetical protein
VTAGLAYALVLAAYAPGVMFALLSKRVWHFPIICFAFLGMFIFNAVGSIAVFSDEKIYWLAFDTSAVSGELAILLVAQAVLFYAVCGPYIFLRKEKEVVAKPIANDFALVLVSVTAIIGISALYYSKTGIFLVQEALSGAMNVDTAYGLREQYVYGVANWPLYNLAFVFIPVLLSNHGLLVFLGSSGRAIVVPLICMLVSFCASLSLGSKGGLLGFLLSLSVAYVTFLGMTGKTPYKILQSGRFLISAALAVLTMIFGYLGAMTESLAYSTILQRMVYRIFVAYPETIAAAISLQHSQGDIGVGVFPSMRGLLSHEQVALSTLLHQYQAHAPGGVSVPFAAEAYLVAGWPSFLVMLPIVFITLVALQEFARLWRNGLFSVGFSAIYAYWALQLSLNGMFASLYNFMYPGTLLVLGSLALVIGWLVKRMESLMRLSEA